MKVKWLGHAAFLITADDGTRVITDPYARQGDRLTYDDIAEAADIVLVSHDHFDHNNVAAVRGSPQVVKGAGSHTVKGIEFKGVAAYHDEAQGSQRGTNTIFCFTLDGIRVCHLGDLGHALTAQQMADIGQVDVLLIPVGGVFTIDAAAATQVCERLNPRVVVPMHFKTPKCTFLTGAVEDFTRGKPGVRAMEGTEVELKKGELPSAAEIVVLHHAQ